VRLILLAEYLILEVEDTSAAMPLDTVCTDEASEAGRGLLLVDLMSSGWGCYRTPDGGKVVWALRAL
jgi:hypothetical protein